MSIALILLNYNDYKTTIKYINFSKEYNSINNIIVVDNCSTNDSYERLKKFQSDRISVIKSDKNGGYAYGNNYGIRFAKREFDPEYIVVSNPDVYFEEVVINKMREILEKNEDISLIAPRIVNNENSNEANSWRLPKYWMNLCKLSILLDKIFYKYTHYKSDEFRGELITVDVIPGSFFMTKVEMFYQIGLFDENTFLFGEENILAYKIKDKGYRNVIMNKYNFLHEHSTSINKKYNTNLKKYKILYNSLDYYNKCYLKTNIFQNLLFYLMWKVSNIEKIVISGLKIIMRKKDI